MILPRLFLVEIPWMLQVRYSVLFVAIALGGVVRAAEPLTPQGTPSGGFARLDGATSGVDFGYEIDTKNPHKHLYVSGFACGGVAAGDLDGDHLPDLFFAGAPGPNRLYLQEKDAQGGAAFRFRDATAAVPLSATDEKLRR